MLHLDPEQIVLFALGEQDPSTPGFDHLYECAGCGRDLSATQAAVRIGRDSQHVRQLPQPSEELWSRIVGQAFTTPTQHSAPAALPNSARPRVTSGNTNPRHQRTRPPRSPRSASQRWRTAVMASAAVVIGAVAVVGTLWVRQPDAERVVAEADLVPQTAAPRTAHGTAQIINTGHGLQLRVAMTGMPATTGYYTAWLYDGGSVMVPLGSPGSAPLNLPAATGDLTQFQIVDISAQRLGQQEHGTSMLQGRLHP